LYYYAKLTLEIPVKILKLVKKLVEKYKTEKEFFHEKNGKYNIREVIEPGTREKSSRR
jgi:hypothetical protein